MLTSEQKSLLIGAALDAFKYQKGIKLQATDFEVKIGEGNDKSLCGILIYTKTTTDNFRMKFYYTGLGGMTACGVLTLTQTQNYATGTGDEMFVADIVLDREKFRTLDAYIRSNDFLEDKEESKGYLRLKDGTGSFVLRNGSRIKLRSEERRVG